MPKARKRKDTQFDNKIVKSVFLYGNPTKDKTDKIRAMQNSFTKLINQYIQKLIGSNEFTMQLVKADKKDSKIRAFEKVIRPKGINAAYGQNAFDIALTQLVKPL